MARLARQPKASKPNRTPTPDPGPESEGESEVDDINMLPPPISSSMQPSEVENSGLIVKDEDVDTKEGKDGSMSGQSATTLGVVGDAVDIKAEVKEGVKIENGLLKGEENEAIHDSGYHAELETVHNAEMRPSPSDFSLHTSPSMPPTSSISTSTTNSPFEPQTPSTPLTDAPQPNDTASRLSNAKVKKPLKRSEPQFIGHLPIARNNAMDTFSEIADNNYQYGTLGRSREALEGMSCDCIYEHGVDHPSTACGQGSDCINRLTQVECLADDCRCGQYCQNQRFQRKDYAPIEIVQTEKKGFGLRAEKDIPKDSFIYEYVGDVVNSPSFKKRMRDYASEGIKHFYFMMLQKDEFIDATKRGGIGRFANHSCSPNCYVAKWTVGTYVRMGIFANRDIKQYEELTFNYNVDRYGHEAQPCYCGEPNCVGYLGGKTQTDIATMDDLYLDALGITDEADLMELKGTKKKKGKKIDDPDFMPILRPLIEKDVPRVIQAMRQTQSRKVLLKLLTRIKMTEDLAPLKQIMRLRGFTVMKNIMDDYSKDDEMLILSLECMSTWPLLAQNKVRDSKVLDHVKTLVDSEVSRMKELAEKLVEKWEALPVGYRIPKRAREDGDEEAVAVISLAVDEVYRKQEFHYSPVIFKRQHRTPPPREPSPPRMPSPPPRVIVQNKFTDSAIKLVIEAANREREEKERLAAEMAKKAEEETAAREAAKAKEKERRERKKIRPAKKHQTPEEKEALKEKRLTKLIGAVVVKCMSKYSKTMDHDTFKKYAKELTQVIVEKEKKSSSYKEGRLESLSDEKVVKIKKFAKEYIAKVMRKLEKSRQDHGRRPPSATDTPSSSATKLDTPDPGDGGNSTVADISVEDVMDMDPDSPSEAEDEDETMDAPDDETVVDQPAPAPNTDQNELMDIELLRRQSDDKNQISMDPRRRPPSAKHDHQFDIPQSYQLDVVHFGR